jgi:DNA-binding LacI/PurR family transcriptional regulator
MMATRDRQGLAFKMSLGALAWRLARCPMLNNPNLVTEQTRLKVEAAIAELGFVRNSAARALAARRTDTVGLILIDIGNSLFVDIARGAESAAGEAQLKLLLANSDSTRTKQDNYPSSLTKPELRASC